MMTDARPNVGKSHTERQIEAIGTHARRLVALTDNSHPTDMGWWENVQKEIVALNKLRRGVQAGEEE